MFREKFNDSIRFRYLSVMFVILFVGTLVISLVIAINEGKVLKNSLMTMGQSFASYIAKLSKDSLVMRDSIQLDAIVNDANKDEDIAYCIIRDTQGVPLTTQFASINYHVPRLNALLAGLSSDNELEDIIDSIKRKEPIVEVSIPVMIDTKTIGAVTIGISEHRVKQQIVKTIMFVIALNIAMAFVLGVALFVVSKKIVLDPLSEIAHASFHIAKGDLSTEVKVRATGEVKTLVDSFNEMVKNLEKVTVSKDYVDNIIRSMMNALIVVSPDNKIIRINNAALRLLGYEEEELIGLPAETIFGGDRSREDSWMKSMSADGHVSNIEKAYKTKDGREVPVLLSASVMRDNNGLMRGAVYVAQDITERKQAYEALQENEQKLYSVIQGAPIPTFVIDKDHKIIYWNRALEELTGFRAQDMVGTTAQWRAFYSEERPCMADMLADENIAAIPQFYSDKHIKSTLLEEAYEVIDFFPTMGEKGKWLRFTAAAIRNSKGNIVGAMETLEDITERKHMEANEIYKTLTETSLSAVIIVQDGKIRFINGSAVAYADYSDKELIGQDSDIIIHSDDRDMVKKMAKEMLSGARNAAFEFRMITKQNQIRWISQTVTPIRFEGRPAILGNAIDVTELRKSREELEELKALESSILESIPHVVLGLQNDKILFVNDIVESVFGWKPEELIGKSGSTLYHSEHEYADISKRIYTDLKNKQTCSQELEVPCCNKSGENVICKVTYSRIGDILDDNKIVATYEDITDKKKASLQLLQSEKMASIGQLAAGVAHEINNPTAFVSSNLKTLSDYLNDIIRLINQYHALAEDLKKEIAGEPLREILVERLKLIEDLEKGMDIGYVIEDVIPLIAESREGTERISGIVQDLKNFAHPGDEKLRAVNIKDSIESTLNIVWNELKYKAVVYKEYGEIPDISGYPQQLNQVFMNILVNAAQAIKEKGEIRIETRVDDGHAEIKFTDTGVGIPKENLPKLFDPFFTTKDVGKGTGLGLHVAYSIIKKHNGTIEVDSMVNKGTTFTIRIPFIKSKISEDAYDTQI